MMLPWAAPARVAPRGPAIRRNSVTEANFTGSAARNDTASTTVGSETGFPALLGRRRLALLAARRSEGRG